MNTYRARAIAAAAAVAIAAAGAVVAARSNLAPAAARAAPVPAVDTARGVVRLSASQVSAVTIVPAAVHRFTVTREALGSIDFDRERVVQVFPPYPGTLLHTFAAQGDEVRRGQLLYTIASPDLIQAESVLIGAAAALDLADKELARARGLQSVQGGIPRRELEQAQSQQQTAEGAFHAARDAMQVFGKAPEEIAAIIARRQVDPVLVVRSPIAGRVTAKNAAPGLLVQPGSGTAPYTVADVSVKWMLASVPESEVAQFHVGQPVAATTDAYPGRVFNGRISKIYDSVDTATHRVTIRSEIADAAEALRAGMLADFSIQTRAPVDALSIPEAGVVREGDGTMTVWVTGDRRRFEQRVVETGLRRDGRVEIRRGLHPDELVVTDGALYLDKMLQAAQ